MVRPISAKGATDTQRNAAEDLQEKYGSLGAAVKSYMEAHLTSGEVFTSEDIADDLGITRGMVTGAMQQYRSTTWVVEKPDRTHYKLVRIGSKRPEPSEEAPDLTKVPCYVLESHDRGNSLVIWLHGRIFLATPFNPHSEDN